MKYIKKHSIMLVLTGIVLLGILLRFYQLGVVPVSLNWDEAAWGYNAYSLSQDARDEFGVFFPYSYIESFGDFKPPLYAYITILPVMFFGLTEFAVRFASAFFGSLTVLMSFFLIRNIFYNAPYKDRYALLTAFLLAVSPWHIMLSRAAFEANLVTFFLVLGVWLFLKGVRDRGLYLILSVIPFVLSLYTFNTARVVTPLLVLLLGMSFMKTLYQKRMKDVIIACILGILLAGPLIPFLLSPQAALRFKEVNIFTDISVIERANQERENNDNALWSRFIHHRTLMYGVSFVQHYMDHFNPDFLFIRGDGNPKFSTQDVGQLYLFEIPFFIGGIILLFRKREGYWYLVPLWILIGIIPAGTARETPHALRIESTLPMFQLMSAIGITWFLAYLAKHSKLLYVVGVGVLASLMIVNISYFVHGYYTHYTREYSGEWQYGYKEAIKYVSSVERSYDKVYVTPGLGRPYIYFLYYLKTDPAFFRKHAVITRDPFGFVHVHSFGKYFFPDAIKPPEKPIEKALYVTLPGEMPGDAKLLKEIPLRNGRGQLVIFTR